MTTKSAAHFTDCDINGLDSGSPVWTSGRVWPGIGDVLTLDHDIPITTLTDLNNIRNDLDGHYYLTNNIDASDTLTWDGGAGFWRIGENAQKPFTGTFDGCGYTISNLYINRNTGTQSIDDYQSLFGYCDGATFYNFNVLNASINSLNGRYMGIVASSITGTTFQGIKATGTVTSATSSGQGGFMGGDINSFGSNNVFKNCSSNVVITTSGVVNGLFVNACQGTFTDCYASGSIINVGASANFYTGGFIGRIAPNSSFTRCSVSGIIPVQANNLSYTNGGFVGSSTAAEVAVTFTDCYYLSSMNELPFGGKDEVQAISAVSYTPTGGHYHITFDGKTTDEIVAFATEAQTQTIVDAAFGVGVLDVFGGTPFYGLNSQDIIFRKQYTRTDVPLLTVDTTALTGTHSPYSFEVATTTESVYPANTTSPTTPLVVPDIVVDQTRTVAFPQDYSHLNGETVQVLGDGSYLGTETVVNGTIALDDATVINHVGLKYTSKIQPMKINGEVNVKRISMIIPDFYETVGGDYGESETTLGTMVLRTSGDPMDTDGDLYSGHIELPFNGSYNRQGDIWITQDEPLPMKLLGIAVRLSEEDI